MMWKCVRKYIPLGVLGALFMVGEVCMDLLQPSLMSEIVDEGVLGLSNGGWACRWSGSCSSAASAAR